MVALHSCRALDVSLCAGSHDHETTWAWSGTLCKRVLCRSLRKYWGKARLISSLVAAMRMHTNKSTTSELNAAENHRSWSLEFMLSDYCSQLIRNDR